MQEIRASSLLELQNHLADFGDEYLFRGQTKQYNSPDGTPNVTSSFNRHGCIPPLMLKWISYTNELLRRGGFNINRPDLLPFTQGLLQHYGWRSFFVDLSEDPLVAAWFAGHSFSSNPRLHLCEDADETPVFLRHLDAAYSQSDGDGHLYVFGKAHLKELGHDLISLNEDLTTDCPSRFQAQKAWLAQVSGQHKKLHPGSIVAHIVAPASVLSDFSNSKGIKTTDDLFPGPDQDQLLANLLKLPWEKIGNASDTLFPAYVRSLEIPNYHVSFVKHLPVSMALYTPLWLCRTNMFASDDIWFHVPDTVFYGSADDISAPLTKLAPYFFQNKVVNIECEGLICEPPLPKNVTYSKGISVRKVANDLFEICNISVDHPSSQLSGAGISKGYAYQLVNNSFVRKNSDSDCPCGDEYRHTKHLHALTILDALLGTHEIQQDGNVFSFSKLGA